MLVYGEVTGGIRDYKQRETYIEDEYDFVLFFKLLLNIRFNATE